MFTNIVQQIKQNNTMKKQMLLLEGTLAYFGLQMDDFFVITFWKSDSEVQLQGHYTPELFEKVSKLFNHGFTLDINSALNQHIFKSIEYNYRITLS